MQINIHAAVQDADNFNLIFAFKAIKDQMLTNAKLIITFPNIIAYASYFRFVSKIMKGSIKLSQVAPLLRFSPLLPCITANREHIGSCLLGEGE